MGERERIGTSLAPDVSAGDTISVNLELLFTEAGEIYDRVAAAASAGYSNVEIWGWRSKDLGRLREVLRSAGSRLVSMTVDPQLDLGDRACHARYLAGVNDSITAALALGEPFLVVVAGQREPAISFADQREAALEVLAKAAKLAQAAGVTLLLEPLNDRVDHPGSLLTSTEEGLDWVREVGSKHLRLLLDAYHSLTMGEDLCDLMSDDVGLVGHVQAADVPGRGEPGTGLENWESHLHVLRTLGYKGLWGMEYRPSVATQTSLVTIHAIVQRMDRAE
ncbi:TIM barrel protein [Leifsonia sp. 2MCAF36]|uniref:TIM barrel protein n=1 Tax=Leifsonia sp. 2MCAF36 TaxID=3232988 RepID=UPI003F9B49FC